MSVSITLEVNGSVYTLEADDAVSASENVANLVTQLTKPDPNQLPLAF